LLRKFGEFAFLPGLEVRSLEKCSRSWEILNSGPAPGEVKKMNPDFVLWTKEGKSYRVRHDAAKAMLLNDGTE